MRGGTWLWDGYYECERGLANHWVYRHHDATDDDIFFTHPMMATGERGAAQGQQEALCMEASLPGEGRRQIHWIGDRNLVPLRITKP